MWAGGAGAIIGAAADIGMGLYNAHRSATEARAADARQYRYALKSASQMPLAQRQGLEAAGYNPMLALGDIGGASAMASHQGTSNVSLDGSSAKALGEFAQNLFKDKAKAEVDNIKADTDLKKGQLEAAESQRLQNEANTALLHSQAERSDLAYGIDIANTITGIAGTGASLYSAKATADVARQNAETNRHNAMTNRQNADRLSAGSERVITNTDKHGKPISETIVSDNPNAHPRAKNNGVPAVSNSANGAKPNVFSTLGHSAASAKRIASEVGTALLLGLPSGILGGAVGAGMYPVRKREMQEHEKKAKDSSRKWYHNFDRFHFDY